MTDYEFIKEFQKIKLTKIANELNILPSNILNGTTSDENLKRVRKAIVKELLILIIKYKGDELLTLALYDDVLKEIENENKMLREMI